MSDYATLGRMFARSLVPGVHSSEREQELDLEMGESVQLPGMAENMSTSVIIVPT